MRVEYDLNGMASRAPFGPAAVSIGFFDGVHLGHQRLLDTMIARARALDAQAVVVTFWPHPLRVVRPDARVTLLTTLDEKLERLAALDGLDATLVMPFTPEFSRLDPEAYLNRLGRWLNLRLLVEGADFALGHNRVGDLAYLRRAGERRGFAVESLEVREDGERVSSTRIRRLLGEGRVAPATRLLGHPYMLRGEVVHGNQRGRQFGFPTANLRVDARKALPPNGVYVVRVALPGEPVARHRGVASIGVRPNFGDDPQPLFEAHLLDIAVGEQADGNADGSDDALALDLYGLELRVELLARLRDEWRFESAGALIAQMRLDAQQARDILARIEREGDGVLPALEDGVEGRGVAPS